MHNDLTAAAALRMDGIYRYQRHVYDLSRRWFLLGRTELIGGLAPPGNGRLLELGCGTAWNLVRAAHRYPSARLYGIDISAEMLDTAARALDRHGLRGRITLAHGDAANFDARRMFGTEIFDRVFISYSLSMIPDWTAVLDASYGVLAPGGEIHLVDFGRCEGLPAAFRRLLFAWLARFSVTPRERLDAHLVRFARDRGLKISVGPLYSGYAVHAVLRRT